MIKSPAKSFLIPHFCYFVSYISRQHAIRIYIVYTMMLYVVTFVVFHAGMECIEYFTDLLRKLERGEVDCRPLNKNCC